MKFDDISIDMALVWRPSGLPVTVIGYAKGETTRVYVRAPKGGEFCVNVENLEKPADA